MSPEKLLADVEGIISMSNIIPDDRNYWLIRTQGGQYYDSFHDNNFVAINYDEIQYSDIDKIRKESKDEVELILGIKRLAIKAYKAQGRPGLIASQLYNFLYKIKKNDVVMIPSSSSGTISLGHIAATPILEISQKEIVKSECPYHKRKAVKWAHSQRRDTLDPYLFKLLQAHQAINDIGHYSEIIERTLGNFYIKNEVANLILDVTTPEKISAADFYSLGYNLLKYSREFINENDLKLSIEDVEIKVNVNSIGKIQLKSPSRETLMLIALLIVGAGGGGLKINVNAKFNLDLSTPGIVKTIIEYQNNAADRTTTRELVQTMDSLKVKPPADVVNILKQFSTNKDKPR